MKVGDKVRPSDEYLYSNSVEWTGKYTTVTNIGKLLCLTEHSQHYLLNNTSFSALWSMSDLVKYNDVQEYIDNL